VKLDKPSRLVTLVQQPEQLDRALIDIAQALVVGLDAERASGFRYSQRAYLLQVATELNIWLIDPIALDESVSGWPRLLGDALSQTVWILHAATQDLPNLAELDIYPTALYDTEVAARLIGLERFGLAAICLELLDLELAKEHSAADWSLRPLSDDMLNYAALDVDVLFDLRLALDQRLAELGRSEWARQEFENLVGFKPRQKLGEPWQHISGYNRLKKVEQQRTAAALWLARDEIASGLDSAPGRLIPDRSIIAAAEAMPKTKRELADLKEFQGRASRSKIDVWWTAITNSAGIEIPPTRDENGIPNHRSWERRWPEAHERLTQLRPVVVELAGEIGISQENLLSPEVLRRLCWAPTTEPVSAQLRDNGAREWQIELVAERITAALAQLAT
jgi:ribonuclease D